ncbi:MAG: FIST C-terminal domain-containing protein [Myxococcota bacterium]|nr:FIST C-terminal domain-containing protein [Myxococcota bacterium]
MAIFAHSATSTKVNSFDSGLELAREIRRAFGAERLAGLVAYSTVSHDQRAFLRGLREAVGAGVPVMGCSGQGVMGRGSVVEDGYAAGAMGLGGDALHLSASHVGEFQVDSAAKAKALGRALREQAAGPLQTVVLHYDPLCGADLEVFLAALQDEVQCPIVGGAAAEFWGPMQQTFQYANQEAFQHTAVAAGLSGAFTAEVDVCHGTSPVGIEMIVTKAEGNCVLEFDGRPALDVWQEFCHEAPEHIDHSGAIGIGLPTRDPDVYLVRCAFGVDEKRRAVIFQAGIPVGALVMLNHRTIRGALEGTAAMGQRLAARLRGKKVRAVLGFECGARTKPFLGKEMTLKENKDLQETLGAGPAWLGMLAWGEVAPFDGRPGFVNFSFPVLALTD